MTEESTPTQTEADPQDDAAVTDSSAAKKTSNNAAKYRLISGEEILPNGEARPSTLAFLGMYVLGALVFGVHLLFDRGLNPADDANLALKLVATLIELTNSETVPIGFVMVMLVLTWANRMLNVSTSGRWTTISLLAITFLPVIITLDNLIDMVAGIFGAEEGAYDFIPINSYNYLIAGLVFTLVFCAITLKYQRSFSYVVTTNAIIFHHSFFLTRAHRRILFDRISEVMVERTPMGTMLGYATVTIMTDSGIGLMEESVGTSAGLANLPGTGDQPTDSNSAKVGKGLLRGFFALISYQRTTRRVDHDPRHCFYKIRKWEDIKMMLNEMHRKHSQSNMLEDIKSALTGQPDTEA